MQHRTSMLPAEDFFVTGEGHSNGHGKSCRIRQRRTPSRAWAEKGHSLDTIKMFLDVENQRKYLQVYNGYGSHLYQH
ncbi:hypothetical protein JG687_00009977 [Phytophthora cactorum]|uniref:Uncharacterized protein n=1 Tax=Phytophthora cactorum TaxID=29920 RepID=A0A8T1UB95_9STRA|nr:hypothetical protein JG687_00009977 [Phytophthora cactorum]